MYGDNGALLISLQSFSSNPVWNCLFLGVKHLVSNRVETNYEIALLILLNGGIWRLQFDLIHDEEQVKGRLFTCKLLVYRQYRRKVKELEELNML